MPEWVAERGIGETRAALIDGDRIIEARVLLDGVLPAGAVVEARLKSVGTGGRNALAVADDGTEILLPQRPFGISEGAALAVEITREAIVAVERWKRPLGRVSEEAPRALPPPGREARAGELAGAGWDDLIEEAQSGTMPFPGGSLGLFATPAMTLIDVDGTLSATALSVAGADAAARAIRRLDIAGSIGIDLPSAGKAARHAAAEAIDARLPPQFERTAVNGFGFVQIVRPRRRRSLLEIHAMDGVLAYARALVRRAERTAGAGARTIAAHPAVVAAIADRPAWIAELERRIGAAVALQPAPALAISAGHVQARYA